MKSYNDDIASNEKVELIHISRDSDDKAAEGWAEENKFPWPTLMKDDAERSELLMSFYGGGVPTYVMIDREGNKVASGKGAIWAKLKDLK